MSTRKNRNKKAQPSAAEVLSATDLTINKETVLAGGTTEMDLPTITKHMQDIVKLQKQQGNMLVEYGSMIKNLASCNDRMSITLEDVTGIVKIQQKEFGALKIANLTKENPSFSQPSNNINADLKAELQQLRQENRAIKAERSQLCKDNQALKFDLEAAKSTISQIKRELRSLKDEFLLNLERQNENALVIHGIPESKDESNTSLEDEVNRIVSTNFNIATTCAEAYRIGKKGSSPRVIKVRWDNKKYCRDILENYKKLPVGIFVNKDRPFILREAKRKIREKAKELWANKIEYEYRNLGLVYNGKFHHYTELEQSTKNNEALDNQNRCN
jgi:hypothetical protein